METIITPHLLVIGGTGFIGHHLLRAAHQRSWQITSVSLNPPSSERLVDGVRYLHFDLTDLSSAKIHLVEDFEYVVNLGGYINHQLFQEGGRTLIETHFIALQNLVEIVPSRKLKRFVQIGSSDEYGNAPAPQHEELREQPISPYSLAKTACTHFLQMLHNTENYPAVTLRLFLTYGPGQGVNRFIPQIVLGCLGDKIFPTSAGNQLRDFYYVDDTVSAILTALVVPESNGEIINVGSGMGVSIREIIELVRAFTGTGKPKYGYIPYRNGENMKLYANTSKMKEILNLAPKVGLKDGLQKTISWYQGFHDKQIKINTST
jgi:nucleoside-diphosphate-sugar epimerase